MEAVAQIDMELGADLQNLQPEGPLSGRTSGSSACKRKEDEINDGDEYNEDVTIPEKKSKPSEDSIGDSTVFASTSKGTVNTIASCENMDDFQVQGARKKKNSKVTDTNGRVSVYKKPVIVKFLDGVTMTNPNKLEKLILNSALGKVMVDFSLRLLGNGSACRLDVVCSMAKNLDVTEIKCMTGIGGKIYNVRCWHPQDEDPDVVYGKIFPVDLEMTEEEIKGRLHVLNSLSSSSSKGRPVTYRSLSDSDSDSDGDEKDGGQVGIQIKSVRRLKNRKGQNLKAIVIGFISNNGVPRKVGLCNTSYEVNIFYREPLRCYKCHLFGHGTITCKEDKGRCSNCAGYHKLEGACALPSFCVLCKENHKYNDFHCEFNEKARDIEKRRAKGEINQADTKRLLKELNKFAKHKIYPEPIPEVSQSIQNNTTPVRITSTQQKAFGSTKGTVYHALSHITDMDDSRNLQKTPTRNYGNGNPNSIPQHHSRSRQTQQKSQDHSRHSTGVWSTPGFMDKKSKHITPNINSEIYRTQVEEENEEFPDVDMPSIVTAFMPFFKECQDIGRNGNSLNSNLPNYLFALAKALNSLASAISI